jgi:lysophospholipase L1-like esterase
MGIANNITDTSQLLAGVLPAFIGDTVWWVSDLPPLGVFIYTLALLFLCTVVILTIRDIVRISIFISLSMFVSLRSTRTQIMNKGGSKKILFAGDSTAVGVGAKRPEETLMGMFAHDFPDVEIHNSAVNGALTRHVIMQLKEVEHEHYSLALISVGGNDAWRFTSLRNLERDLDVVLRKAMMITDNRVILLIYNMSKSDPVAPIFLHHLLIRHSLKINQMFRVIASNYGIKCVEIFTEGKTDPFGRRAEKVFAPDGFHPNSRGYRLWYNRLWRILAGGNYGLHDPKLHSSHPSVETSEEQKADDLPAIK